MVPGCNLQSMQGSTCYHSSSVLLIITPGGGKLSSAQVSKMFRIWFSVNFSNIIFFLKIVLS